MKKYLLLVLLAVLCVFTLTGCVEKRLVGEWELVGFEYKGKEYSVEDFLTDVLYPDEDWDDGELEDEVDGMIEEFPVLFKENGKGKAGDVSFNWEADGKEIEIDFKDKSYGDYEAVLEGKRLKLEYEDFFDNKTVYLIFEKK